MEIRQLNNGNPSLLQNVADDVFDYPVNFSYLTSFLACPRHLMLLAVEGTVVIGMVSAVEYFHPDKPAQMWINELSVTPAHQNQGIGRALIREILSIAREKGCVAAWVGTENSNVAANRCYASVDNADPTQQFVLHEWNLAKQQDDPSQNCPR